jgi:tetratricopeptide (TPR) repeat protein
MDVEIENARAAWDWAAEEAQVDQLYRAVDGLCRFYSWRARSQEGRNASQQAAKKLAAVASVDGVRILARLLTWQAEFVCRLGDNDLGCQLLDQSLALLDRHELADEDTRSERAFALLQMGEQLRHRDHEQANALLTQSLHLYQELGDRAGKANALGKLAKVAAIYQSDYDKATRLFEQTLAIQRSLEDQKEIAETLMGLSIVAACQDKSQEAERLQRESIAICRRTGNRPALASGLDNLGGILAGSGKYTEAHLLLEESRAISDVLGIYSPPFSICTVQIHLGLYDQARDGLQAVLTSDWQTDPQQTWAIGLTYLLLGHIALAAETYAEARRFLEESITISDELEFRLWQSDALALLRMAARGLNEPRPAEQSLCDALRLAVEIWDFERPVCLLPAIAIVLADRGKVEQAVELYALASCGAHIANSHWFEDVFGRHIAAIAATLPPDVVAAARERGRQRDLWATVEELLFELDEQLEPDPP